MEEPMKSNLWRTPADRRMFIGGSDARIIMGHHEAALVQLWREKRGEAEPEDLSRNLVVQLGAATEELNRFWYERNTGRRVTDIQRKVKHSDDHHARPRLRRVDRFGLARLCDRRNRQSPAHGRRAHLCPPLCPV